MNILRIILADDHKLILDGLAALLQDNDEIKIISVAENGQQLVEQCRILKPDFVITDIDMPVLSGEEAVKVLRAEFPELKILVLTMHLDARIFNKMKEAGANGYLHKNSDKEELLFAINQILKGKEYASSEIKPIEKSFKIPEVASEVALTKREIEIISLVALGLTNIEIGKKLFISDRTVDTHRTNLMRKLNINNVAGLIRFAYTHKLID